MSQRNPDLPILCVEGPDDVAFVAAMLKRYGFDTEQGTKHLYIKSFGGVAELLDTMAVTVKSERHHPCGFVIDIDIECSHRWQAVCDRLKFMDDPTTKLESAPPSVCPFSGYYGKVKNYQHPFGIWLMPDCRSDGRMLEHLLPSLIPNGDPLWPHAQRATREAADLVDQANMAIPEEARKWRRFGDQARMKAEIRTWLAWQREPGIGFGAAINAQILGHNSVEAAAFLEWLKTLFRFDLPSPSPHAV